MFRTSPDVWNLAGVNAREADPGFGEEDISPGGENGEGHCGTPYLGEGTCQDPFHTLGVIVRSLPWCRPCARYQGPCQRCTDHGTRRSTSPRTWAQGSQFRSWRIPPQVQFRADHPLQDIVEHLRWKVAQVITRGLHQRLWKLNQKTTQFWKSGLHKDFYLDQWRLRGASHPCKSLN